MGEKNSDSSANPSNGETESLLSFPCEFTIKIFGLKSDEFEISVLNILRNYVDDLKENAISSRNSKTNKYMSLSVTLPVNSKSQLDAIYLALNADPHVLMTL